MTVANALSLSRLLSTTGFTYTSGSNGNITRKQIGNNLVISIEEGNNVVSKVTIEDYYSDASGTVALSGTVFEIDGVVVALTDFSTTPGGFHLSTHGRLVGS